MNPMSEPASPGPDTDPDHEPHSIEGDADDDPAHATDEDEGWTSEGGATPVGPATDVEPHA